MRFCGKKPCGYSSVSRIVPNAAGERRPGQKGNLAVIDDLSMEPANLHQVESSQRNERFFDCSAVTPYWQRLSRMSSKNPMRHDCDAIQGVKV